MPDLQTQYATAVEVFKELAPTQQAPSLKSIEAALNPKQLKYIEKHKAELVIAPALSLYDLIEQIDKKQPKKTYIYHDLWDQYELGSELRVDFLVPKLMFTSQTYEQQRRSIASAKKNLKGLRAVDPRAYLVAQVIRRETGRELLDQYTWRVTAQPPKESVGGGSVVGRVLSDGGGFGLDWGYGRAGPDGGVGLSVGLELNSQPSDLVGSFASELPDELTINGKVYRAV